MEKHVHNLVTKISSISIEDVEIRPNINLDRFTTIKLAGCGTLAQCYTETGLMELLRKCRELSLTYHMIGWGANQVLVRTEKTLFVKLEFPFDKNLIINHLTSEEFDLPASTSLNQLTSLASKYGLIGWEVFTGIPASLGGAICMNAGTSLGAIGELINEVRILTANGEIRKYRCDENSFSYRKNNFLHDGEVILSATMRNLGLDPKMDKIISDYLFLRKNTQPLDTKNCGSVFKNHPQMTAGRMIDVLGLKSFGLTNLKVSQKHGNFIEHSGGATAKEFDHLVLLLKDEIERFSGIKFELEVKIY